jgi:hypothetical protein
MCELLHTWHLNYFDGNNKGPLHQCAARTSEKNPGPASVGHDATVRPAGVQGRRQKAGRPVGEQFSWFSSMIFDGRVKLGVLVALFAQQTPSKKLTALPPGDVAADAQRAKKASGAACRGSGVL